MSPNKRKAEEPVDEVVVKKKAPLNAVQKERIRVLRPGIIKEGSGPVIYWMSRDQRMNDNWALLYALQQAGTTAPVAVAFNLVPAFLGAGARMFGFMLRGLKEMEPKLKALNIEFFLLQGDPANTLPELVKSTGAKLLVTDFSPLRIGLQWREQVCAKVDIPVHEVDTHNIVPVWTTSNKREVAARTIRPKIHKHLPQFLKEFPEVKAAQPWQCEHKPTPVDWDALIQLALEKGKAVPEVTWVQPGEAAARDALLGPKGFLTPGRLAQYESRRNDPNCPEALSNLSPYFHFGQLAPQRAALEALQFKTKYKASVDSFIEEMVVRRELSDNFCFFTPNYDSFDCAAEWAKESLTLHESDKREWLYTQDQLEAGKTHDDLWNATQLEMVHHGKMHGYMRMYWAKKILEWTPNAQEAIRIGIYLNDKYELDGRDPNGYVGVMWSMVGIHDQGWAERAVFGKIRYMNYNGCKRKFDVQGYIHYVNRLVKATKSGSGGVAPPPPKSIFTKALASNTGAAAAKKLLPKAAPKPSTDAKGTIKKEIKKELGIKSMLKPASGASTSAVKGERRGDAAAGKPVAKPDGVAKPSTAAKTSGVANKLGAAGGVVKKQAKITAAAMQSAAAKPDAAEKREPEAGWAVASAAVQ